MNVQTRSQHQMPQKFPHMFTEIVFQLVPEVDYRQLCHLSQIAEAKQEKERYRSLVDALRKMQWARLAGLEAAAAEQELEKDIERVGQGGLVVESIGQVQHAKALFDFVAHAKAALDSLAVFLTAYFSIDAAGSRRDFRRTDFRKKVGEADAALGAKLQSLQTWLDARRPCSDSLVAVRDEWLHRGSPGIALLLPRPEVGALAIPKAITVGSPFPDLPATEEHYWSTPSFVEFHFRNLTSLFRLVVKRCIELELATLKAPPPAPARPVQPIAAFPLRVLETTEFSKMAFGARTGRFFGGGPGSAPSA